MPLAPKSMQEVEQPGLSPTLPQFVNSYKDSWPTHCSPTASAIRRCWLTRWSRRCWATQLS